MIRLLFLVLCIFFAMSNINYVNKFKIKLVLKKIFIIFLLVQKTSNNNVFLAIKQTQLD